MQLPVSVALGNLQKDKDTGALAWALGEGYEFKSLGSNSVQLVPPLEDPKKDSAYRVTPEINGRRGLRLEKRLYTESLKIFASGNECPHCTVTLHARFEPNLDELVPSETFAEVFVADESGNVIVARSDKERSTDTRFEQLDRLLRPDPVTTPQSAPSQISEVGKQQDPLWNYLPLRKKVRLGDMDYYLYAQAVPIDSHLRATNNSEFETGRLKLVVAGLVPVSEVLWSALAIPHGVSLTLIFISFALTFTLPLIKLMTMGPKDRLGLTDALGCMLFSLMGTALLTFTIGSWTLHDHVRTVADGRLESAAKAIGRNFKAELENLVSRLQKLTMDSNGTKQHKVCGLVGSVSDGQIMNRLCVGVNAALHLKEPLILTTIWVDALGDIKSLETIRRTSIMTTNIRERPYLRDAWTDRLLTLDTPGITIPFSIEPIFAWDDGELGTMLATRAQKLPNEVTALQLGEVHIKPEDFVVAIRAPMHSLVDAVVPVGYGYAVIDRDGKVFYASDKDRNLRENLFSETDNDPQLKSLVSAATSGTTRVNYRGRSHVMYVSCLHKSVPWTLIVYRDTHWLDWVTDQSLFFGVALFTAYSLVILVAGLFALIIFQSVRSGDGSWMWPTESRSPTYLLLVVSNILFLLLAMWTVHQWSITHPVLAIFGVVLLSSIAMAIMVGTLKIVSSNNCRLWSLDQRNCYLEGKRTLLAIVGNFVSRLWPAPSPHRILPSTCPESQQATAPKNSDAYERGGLSPLARWTYSSLSTTAILIMAAMPSATFLTVGFQRALSLYESYSVDVFHQDIRRGEEERKRWLKRILPNDQFASASTVISTTSENQSHDWASCAQNSDPFRVTQYWSFLFDCPFDHQGKRLKLENLSADPPEWFKETTRSLFHLWMWEPGRKLGGWVGHSVDQASHFEPFLLFPVVHQPISLIIGVLVLVLIAIILGYARLCEDVRLMAWRNGFAFAGFVIVFVLLGYFAGFPNKQVAAGLSLQWILHIAIGCGLLISAAYVCQRIVSHYLFLMDFAEPLVNREFPITDQLASSRSTNRILIVLPPEGSGIKVPSELRNLTSPATKDMTKWNFVSIPTLLEMYDATEQMSHPFIEDALLPLAIVGFDFRLSERRQAVRMLKLMERLSLQSDRSILVVAHRHPFDSEIVSFESSDIPVQDRSIVLSRDRWAEAFKDFIVIPLSEFKDANVYETVILPIVQYPTSFLGQAPQFTKHADWVDWGKKVMYATGSEIESEIRYALGVLRCRYEYWWADCTPSEKLALWHVATDRFLHAANSKLYPLLWKGLLKLEPDIKICDKSFHQFVIQAGDRDELTLFRQDLKPSTWAKVSRPLLLSLLSAVMFLAVTQENVRDVVIAFAPVLPAFLIEIPRLLGGNIRAAISKET